MEWMDSKKVGEFQKSQRKLAQKYIDELASKNIYIDGKVKIIGMWHSIHNGKILKAPIQTYNPFEPTVCMQRKQAEDDALLSNEAG